MSSIFDVLTDLPLFKGVSHEKMTRAAGQFRFEFKKFAPSEVIVKAGDLCGSLIFILSGRSTSVCRLHSGITVEQLLPEKVALAPEFLFGRTTSHPATVTAVDDCAVLEIQKSDYTEIVRTDRVFFLNYLNLLCQKSQKCYDNEWFNGSAAVRLAAIADYFSDAKSLEVTVSCDGNLYELLGVSLDEYRSELNRLKDLFVVKSFDDSKAVIADRRELLSLRDK